MNRLQRDGLPIGFHGRIQPALFFQDDAEIIVRLGMIGIDRQNLFIGRLRIREASHFLVGVAEIRAGLDIARVELNGQRIGFDRIGKQTRALKDDAVIESIDRIAGIDIAGLYKPLQPLRHLPAPIVKKAEAMERFRTDR